MPIEDGADANAAWTETHAARVLGMALTAQPEFWEHVAAVRAGEDARSIARGYVRRDQGRRVELVVAYLTRAAEGLDEGRSFATWDCMNIAGRAWAVGPARAPSDPRAPARALRDDAAETIERAALRVARRGARRCADADCDVSDPPNPGARPLDRVATKLARDSGQDYCGACAPRHTTMSKLHPGSDVEGERLLFDRAVFAVLGGDSRARRRREA